jgi:hypothetical protein
MGALMKGRGIDIWLIREFVIRRGLGTTVDVVSNYVGALISMHR